MKFICDVMLGRLAKYLRMLGLDAIYLRDFNQLHSKIEKEEPYYFFTKRTKNIPVNAVIVKSDRVREQLKEIFQIIGPYIDSEMFFTRCINCNEALKDIEKSEIEGLVPEYIYHNHFQFKICPSCKKIFWAGSHVEHMEKLLEDFLIDSTDSQK